MLRQLPARLTAVALAIAALLAAVPLAHADPPTVHVRVSAAPGAQGTVDGTVTVTSGGRTFTCHTHGGTCTMTGVPGGPASATFTPDGGGAATAPRSVMIAPAGDTQLVLSAGR